MEKQTQEPMAVEQAGRAAGSAPEGRAVPRGRRWSPLRGARHDQRGITTAEYAVGTAAGAGLAGLAYQLLTGGLGTEMLSSMFDHVLGLLGIG